MSKYQTLLSAGLEAFETPPSLADVTPPQLQNVFGGNDPAPLDTPPPGVEVTVVTPSPFDVGYVETPELLREEIAAREALVELIQEEREIEDSRLMMVEVRRASDGLEGLMVEIQNVNNPEEPTEDELAMLRSTASLVRKEVLDEDDQSVVIDLENGVLVGSQEGLGDAIANVAKKISFAMGNALSKFASSGDKVRKPLTYNRSIAKDLKERVGAFKTTTFTFTLPASLVKWIRVAETGKPNLVSDVASLTNALGNWYTQPSAAAAGFFDKHEAIIKACLAAKSLEEFDKVYDGFKALKAPLPSSAKKIEPVNTKEYIFDAYNDAVSMGGIARWYYIARPDGQGPEEVLRAIRSFNVGIYSYGAVADRKAEDVEVTVSKAELIGFLDVILKCCDVIDTYLSRLSIMSTFDKRYNDLVGVAKGDFTKNEWVNRDVQRKIAVAITSLDAYYTYGFSYTNAPFELFDVIVKLVKKAVYKSDLSKVDDK